jgi:hypothetical protein
MCICNIILIAVIWALLGLHSAWYTKKNMADDEFDGLVVLLLIISFLFPIISHFATWICKEI